MLKLCLNKFYVAFKKKKKNLVNKKKLLNTNYNLVDFVSECRTYLML
jgi:hypothetical protein